MSWFRVHTGLLNNAKAQSLEPKLFKALINLWCLAKDGDGIIPHVQVVAFQLRLTAIQARAILDDLIREGFLDCNSDGTFKPHDWNEHQYKSDVSTGRVKRFRERNSIVSETPSEYRVQSTESEQSQKQSGFPRKPPEEWPNARAFVDAWKRHKKWRHTQPEQVVMQTMIGRNGTVDWHRLVEIHPAFCSYWERKGWDFCSLTFLDWIDMGMPPPPPEQETEADRKRKRLLED